jgi:subtilisin-like proprotein convertase family protein
MRHRSGRTVVNCFPRTIGRRPSPPIRLGRDCKLEERLAPAGLTEGPVAPTALTKQQTPEPVLVTAPSMPGLADLDVAIAGAVQRAWAVPVGIATATWAVGLAAGHDVQMLRDLGAVEISAVPFWADVYNLRFASLRDVAAFGNQLAATAGVEFAYPLIARQEVPRFIPNDPLFANQWHLRNTGQTFGTPGADANVTPVWDQYRGTGVVIGIVDDGLQHTHQDLASNYDATHSFDFNFGDPDPAPDPAFDFHGTAVAGVAAARGNNGEGVTGAAFEAQVAGLRLLAAPTTDNQEAAAETFANQNIAIYNNSWGPADNGFTLLGPGPQTLVALNTGVTAGRGGNGSIYTWAGGNGRESQDNVNYDGYANSRYVIAVGAIDHNGEQASYSESGAPLLVTAYSSSEFGPEITTTDLLGGTGYDPSDYTSAFGGTSSASPLVAGVIALMLQANPNLTARDVQHILVRTARMNDPTDGGWTTNGAGRHVNHKYGFGAIDAEAAVNLAKNWATVKPENSVTSGTIVVNQTIPDDDPIGVTSTFNLGTNLRIEHVEVVLNATHTYRGDLEIVLTAPSGTQSILAQEHLIEDGDNYSNWVFTTVRDWDEMSAGTWSLSVRDKEFLDVGDFNNWTLRVYGTEPANAPSLFGIEATTLQYFENQSTAVSSGISVVDIDSAQMSSATVQISGGFTPAEDELLFAPQGGITGSFNAGVLTLTGLASKAAYQAALRSVQYHNLSETPSTATRTVTFAVTDPDGLTSTPVSRNISVILVNDAPSFVKGPDVTVAEDSGPQTVDPWATGMSPGPGEESQSVTFEVVSNTNPGFFSAGPAVSPTGVLTFTPAPDATGVATIEVRARDDGGTANGGQDASPPQSFTITITPENDAPVAVGDVYNATEDTVLTVTVPGALGNDKDADGNPLTAAKLTDPVHGVLTFNTDGSFTYTPAADFTGTDSFTYKANDGLLDSAPGVVTIRVLPVNDRPVATDDTFNAGAGRRVMLNVLANDTDVDGDMLRVSSYSRTAKGRLTRFGNALAYTASPGATGTDTFTYTVSDGHGGTDTGTVTLNVIDGIAPRVTAVRLHYGSGSPSVIDLRSLSRSVLPWANVTSVEFVFSEDVQVAAGDFTLTGVLGGSYALDFAYDPVAHTAVWSRATGLPIDRFTLRLSAAAIQDRAGNPLAADWARTFAILPGDLDGNGMVDDKDLAAIKRSYTRPGRPVARFADVNGDGKVDVNDLNAATAERGRRAP